MMEKDELIYNLKNGLMGNIELRGIDLKNSDIKGAILKNADLTCANFSNADLSDTDLRGSILTGAILREANLTNAKLCGAELFLTNLTKTNLTNSNFEYVECDYSNFKDAIMTNVKGYEFIKIEYETTSKNNIIIEKDEYYFDEQSCANARQIVMLYMKRGYEIGFLMDEGEEAKHYGICPNFKKAIDYYTKAIKVDENFKNAYYWRGLSRKRECDYYGAIEDFTKVIELNPLDSNAYMERSLLKSRTFDKIGADADSAKWSEIIQSKRK